MKKLLLAFCLALSFTGLKAQTVFESTDFVVDTLTNSDTITNPMTGTFLSEYFDKYLVVHAVFQNLADTATITSVIEESMDGTYWTPTDTIVQTATSIGGNTLSYVHSMYLRLRYVRIKTISAGTSSLVRKRLWAVIGKKPY